MKAKARLFRRAFFIDDLTTARALPGAPCIFPRLIRIARAAAKAAKLIGGFCNRMVGARHCFHA
jgi:hypothetical protein